MIILQCFACGLDFKVPNYRVGRPMGDPKYCSSKCYNLYRSTHKNPSNRPPSSCHPDRPLAAHGLCQPCYAKKHAQENREAYQIASRKHVFKKSYGMTTEDYDVMVTRQNGLCAICGKPPKEDLRTSSRLHVDHNKVTGKVRELLCGEHNRGLGLFSEDPKLLQKAIEYLNKHDK